MSTIFTHAEEEEIKKREKGDYSDKRGLFVSRIKPKILEILAMDRKWLKRLIKARK